jgi:tripeptide aminopeptidase
MILEVARRCTVEGSPVSLELLFTVAEEVGLQGAKRFDASKLRSDFGYVFDHATPIGELVTASPTLYRIEAEFHGKSAHAGLRPEAGRSAILAAAHAAVAMPHGRIDEQTTANVGFLHGGVESTNVVPDRARIFAEARSVDLETVEEVLAAMIDALHDGASHGECDVDVITEKQVVGYRSKPSSPVVVAAEAALRAHGYEPRRIATSGASDANVLEAAGIPTVNIANGTENNHEPTERVSVAALDSMLDVAFSLLDEAAVV